MNRLSLLATNSAEDPLLDVFMERYRKVFTLPDESEDRDGFAACMALNHGEAYERLSGQYEPFREMVGVAVEEPHGIVGGANFLAGPVMLEDAREAVSVHLNYIHIDPAYRRAGRLRQLVEAVCNMASRAFTDEAVPVVTFLELNDPLAMSKVAYAADTKASGIDQVARLRAWARLGARIVDFPYVQPELAQGDEPNRALVLAAISRDMDTIPTSLLRAHLYRFFGVSVAKGGELAQSALDQLEILDAFKAPRDLALIDPLPAVAALLELKRDHLPRGNIREFAARLAGDGASVGHGD